MKLALVADWVTTSGGAERALAEMHDIWPASPLFTTVYRRATGAPLHSFTKTTRLQTLYRIVQHHQLLLPLMPRAIEDIDLRGYDVILSSSHAVGKGIIPPSSAVHVCYCHTPMRYAWEMEKQYLDDFKVPRVLRGIVRRRLSELRRWDLTTAKRVDVFIANSMETAERIERTYGRTATVISPPAHRRFFDAPLPNQRSGFLAVGRFVPYKRFDVIIEVANAMRLPLTIAGSGQEEARLRAMAGPTVRFLGRVSDEQLPALYASASAVIFPAHEDAGIVPIEAQACGTPVIAYGKGGTRDTVVDGKTGLFFEQQNAESLKGAIRKFSPLQFENVKIREHAQQFSSGEFRGKIEAEVRSAMVRYGRGTRA